MKYILLTLTLLLAACGPQSLPEPTGYDQCLRTTLFQQCLAALPKGPTTTTAGNDWDDVVDSCESAARQQSWRKKQFIKPECQS